MRKHNDVISTLTSSQKVRLLTGAGNMSEKDMKILGIPQINMGDMKDYGRGLFPNVTALANSWSKKLWHDVAREKTDMMLRDGKNLIFSPGAKIKLSPYRREISEDPYLASEISAAHRKAVSESGAVSALSGLYLTRSDIEWLDEKPNERVVREFISSPFKNAMKDDGLKAVITDARETSKNYGNVTREISDELISYADYMICKSATDENTVDFIARGVICLEGSEIALESAIARYKKLKKSIENNEGALQSQLDEEIERRTAISPETVDDALDKLIEFIYSLTNAARHDEDVSGDSAADALSLKTVVDSTVLLKNRNELLPLEYGSRVAIIGDMAFRGEEGNRISDKLSEGFKERGYKVVGAERGYNMSAPHDNGLVDAAVNLAAKCDTVVLFLGFGYEAEKKIPKTEMLSLPANQLYLANRISMKNKHVVAVISSGHAPDIEFTRAFDAVLFAPLEVKMSADAMLKILSGEQTPSGKLAYTLYAGSDAAFQKAKIYRKKYGMKSGPFIGYRYYDTADLTVGYPFGHGLSYARFKYSSLVVNEKSVNFTVENISQTEGSEVVQLYIGEENPMLINPQKELMGFEKIRLLPGEKKSLTIPLVFPTRYIDGKYVTPGGAYTVAVGSSVTDIRLTSSIIHNGPEVKPDGERLCDYLQSVSNVREDNYTLEANYSVMKKSILNILFGIVFVALAISAAIFNATTEHPSDFVGVLAGILAVIAIVFFVCEAVIRSRLYSEERKKVDEVNKEKFDVAEQIPVLSTAKMFMEEFEEEEVEHTAVIETIDETGDNTVNEFIDRDYKFAMAAADLKAFFSGKGFILENAVAENLLASIATSGLIVTGGLDSEQFTVFARLLSEYFGTDAFIDTAPKKASGDNLYFSYDYHGDHTRKNILLALEYARENLSKVVIAAIDGVSKSVMEEYIAPFTKYLYSPKTANKISLHGTNGADMHYNIAPNFRLLINLSDKVSIDSVAPHISTLAAVNKIKYEKGLIDETFTGVRELNRHQLEYMREKECTKAEVSEDVWKKIDKIEKYAARFSDYRIGNKLWLGFEKHVGMLLAAGLETKEAIDNAVAARLISSLAVSLKDKIPEDEQNLTDNIEFIFGEGNADVSKSLLLEMIFEVIEEVVEEIPEVQPVVEELVVEVPVTEEVKADEPVAEVPVTEEVKADEPVAEVPVTEEVKADEPVAEVPVTEEVKADEPVAEVPVTEEVKADEPVAEAPVTEEVKADEPVAEEIKIDSDSDKKSQNNKE